MKNLPLSLTLALTSLAACGPEEGDTTVGSSTGDGTTQPASTGTTATETTATDTTDAVEPTVAGSTTTDPGTTTEAGSATSTTTEAFPDPTLTTTVDRPDTRGDECEFTCGVSIECELPGVPDSEGAPPCMPGFHCEDASACGCAVTWCAMNCDPKDPNACSAGQVCDPVSGVCVDR